MDERTTFARWCAEVASRFDSRYGEELDDSAPVPLLEWYEEGLDAEEAARRAYLVVMGG